MKTNIKICFLFILAGFANNDCRDNIDYVYENDKAVKANAKVVFEDDFNTAGIPDKTKWELCPRMEGDSWGNYFSMSYDQAYVKDGKLILKAEKVNGEYKSGGVWSKGLFDFTYGKVEVRARIKTGDGGIPAIWLLASTGQPLDGEIDIVEQYDNQTEVHHTVHSYYTNKLGNKTDPVRTLTVPCKVNEFNVYAVEWTSEKVSFSINGMATLTYPNLHLAKEIVMKQWPFKRTFFIILNYTLSMYGVINDAELPVYMEVDWVRVTQ